MTLLAKLRFTGSKADLFIVKIAAVVREKILSRDENFDDTVELINEHNGDAKIDE